MSKNQQKLFLSFLSILSFLFFTTVARAAEEATETGIAGTFGVDWMKFAAQLLNFGIILLVLWKFVFTPVTKKLEERTAKIEKAMLDASNTEKAKGEFFHWKETEMVKIKSQAQGIIAAAQSEGGKAKQQILDEVKQEQEKVVSQAKIRIEEEKNQAVREVKSQMADLVTLASEKIIRQKLDGNKDKELIEETLQSIS